MMKKDISAKLYRKCRILCNKILLNVLHDTSVVVLLSQQHTGFQISSYEMLFLSQLGSILICANGALIKCVIQRVYKYVSLSLLPGLTFFEPKITNILSVPCTCMLLQRMPQFRMESHSSENSHTLIGHLGEVFSVESHS